MADARAAATPALALLRECGAAHQVHEYELEPLAGPAAHRGARLAYGAAAAAALGIEPSQLFKTLVVALDGGTASSGELALAVLPSDCTLSERAVAAALGAKRATLATAEAVQRATGSVLGGVSPLGTRRPMRTVIDASAQSLSQIVVSAGRRGLAVSLTPSDLRTLCDGEYVAISTR